MIRVALVALAMILACTQVQAKTHHHKHHYKTHHVSQTNYNTAKPHAWCGWWMRLNNGRGDPGVDYNLARNWSHWGSPSVPKPGAIAVYPHHVVKILQVLAQNVVLAISGNDGHAVRVRPRSLAGAIAVRD